MKRLLVAALLALPLSLAVGPMASAQCCIGLKGAFNVKVCATGTGFLCPYFAQCGPGGGKACGSHGCGPGAGGYGGGPGACGYGGGACAGGSCGEVPGPWYTYWPQSPGGPQVGLAFPGWSLEHNFNTPAPVSNGYASYFGAPASQGGGFGAPGHAYAGAPAGYYPGYAYQPAYNPAYNYNAGYAGMNYAPAHAPAPVQQVGYYPGSWYGR